MVEWFKALDSLVEVAESFHGPHLVRRMFYLNAACFELLEVTGDLLHHILTDKTIDVPSLHKKSSSRPFSGCSWVNSQN